uniref:Recombinase RecA n=1 Tax=Schlesneria paludicola TaxID=360056 RepID=A0A7C4QUH4_9PLAN
MLADARVSTGIAELDQLLGGGLLPGTLTVVLGATGIGKTQLGLQFAQAGLQQEGHRGCVFDMTTRGDGQNHAAYAQRLCGWTLRERPVDAPWSPAELWNSHTARFDYFHLFQRSGRRVTIRDLDPEQWQEWKAELNRKLEQAIAFFYGNFVHGVRRCVIDGVEPADRASESFQFHVFDYVYHQILHKDHDWVARDLFRVHYRQYEPHVLQHAYDHRRLTCLLLYTAHEVLLDELLCRPLETGDELANANTILLMGKIREGRAMRRALHVAKHRGSACDEAIVTYEITDRGLRLEL